MFIFPLVSFCKIIYEAQLRVNKLLPTQTDSFSPDGSKLVLILETLKSYRNYFITLNFLTFN